MNPTFSVHDIYVKRQTVNDIYRSSFTRFRVSGHSLSIETGRWNKRGRGRLPLEERLCRCGDVQSEIHVVEGVPRRRDLGMCLALTRCMICLTIIPMKSRAELSMTFCLHICDCYPMFGTHI